MENNNIKIETEPLEYFTDVPTILFSGSTTSLTTCGNTSRPLPIIRHIVIAGGGIAGFSYYGAIRESAKKDKWKIENIQSIYGTSAGAILAVMLALKYDWETLDDYLIKRPWQNVFKFDMNSMIGAIHRRGILEIKTIEDVFSPLFLGKDIPLNITMKSFFDLTAIDLHLFTTEIGSFNTIDISHKTHPDWTVTDAIYASSSLPILFSPLCKNDHYYCDGFFLLNYPLRPCIENGANPEEIIGFSKLFTQSTEHQITKDTTLLDYIFILLNKIMSHIFLFNKTIKLAIEYTLPSMSLSIFSIYSAVVNMEERIHLIDIGVKTVVEHEDVEKRR